ncbi:MAG: hypothetical protein LBN93_00990 [Candidatus Symbiothrix sp.]|jgi:hypothetical protein|nr:hypothetical protein [Candidatus Symbiothrix sp.]
MKRKMLVLLITALVVAGNWLQATAQIAVGSVNDSITPGALLDLSQGAGGLLLPKVTAEQMSDNPDLLQPGMMVFNTDDRKVYTYGETDWISNSGTGGGGGGGTRSCSDYVEGSWQVGNICFYPTDSSSGATFANGIVACPRWWRLPSYSEINSVRGEIQSGNNMPVTDGAWVALEGATYWLGNYGVASGALPTHKHSYTSNGGTSGPSGSTSTVGVIPIWYGYSYDGASFDINNAAELINLNRVRCVRNI